MKYINTFTITLLSLSLAGCGGMNADQQNDTGFGDDDGGLGETGGDPFEPPPPIEDHGVGEYCVNRAQSHVAEFGVGFDEFDISDVHDHERWHHSLQREYGGAFDFSGKPELNEYVPNILPAQGWPLTQLYVDDAIARGGLASGLVSGYHMQLPFVGVSGLMNPALWEFPYAVDIVTNAALPSAALRHSWASVGCCGGLSLTDEEYADPAWFHMTQPGDFWSSIDCSSYVLATGVSGDAAGFPRYPTVTERDVAELATCMTGGGRYTPDSGIMEAISYMRGDPMMAPDRLPAFAAKSQAPAIINYHWISTLAQLVDWQATLADAIQYVGAAAILHKFNISVQAVVTAMLWVADNLYLPPDDFQHARYGIGGGCMFPVIVMHDPDTDSWWSAVTCPVGYYAEVPTFFYNDEIVRSYGIGGVCKLDGIDSGGLVDTGQVLAPSPIGTGTYHVADLSAFADMLTGLGKTVTPSLADAIADADAARMSFTGHGIDLGPVIEVGDTIAWSSTPDGVKMSMADAMLASIGYDDLALTELSEILGWSLDVTHEWIDEQPIGTLAVLLADRNVELPPHLAKRTTVSLRRHHAWHMRIESDTDGDRINDRVTFLHFVG